MTLGPGGRDAGLEWGSGRYAGGMAFACGRAAPIRCGHECPDSGGIHRVGSSGRSNRLILQSKGVDMATEVRSASSAEGPHLRRELHLWEAVGISLALMAPSMAANINPQGTASTIGRAVPLAFALATIGVLLIAWTFVRLTQRFNHAGSVYGFVGATLGPRAGVISGWSLMGTYTFYSVVTATATGIFGAEFLDALGIWTNQPEWAPYLVGAIALAGVWALAVANIREGTRVLLVIEATTVALILIVSVVILIRLATGTAPNGNTLDFSVFSIPGGIGTSAVFLGVVFGFLSFAGFEAAATLGEEAQEPRRDIPRAILGVAIFGGLYYVFVSAVEMMGFGTDQSEEHTSELQSRQYLVCRLLLEKKK